jgi:heptosyltransferase-2
MHERFYYLELLRRGGMIEHFPQVDAIRLDRTENARESGTTLLANRGIRVAPIGVSPGAAYGNAKRWLPERFAESAQHLARSLDAPVMIFGGKTERPLCDAVAEPLRRSGVEVHNIAGETRLGEFIDMAAACRLFLTNDSGGMHVASALAVPTVAIFGATDDSTTGPTGPLARVVREHAECSPCLLRECPIDHRCMTGVSSEQVVAAAETLVNLWTPEPKS